MTEPRTAADLRQLLGLLTETELALALEVKESTLQTWRSNKVGPAYAQLGKAIFYRAEDVAMWASQKAHPLPVMIVSRTPLQRGGGSDYPTFHQKHPPETTTT